MHIRLYHPSVESQIFSNRKLQSLLFRWLSHTSHGILSCGKYISHEIYIRMLCYNFIRTVISHRVRVNEKERQRQKHFLTACARKKIKNYWYRQRAWKWNEIKFDSCVICMMYVYAYRAHTHKLHLQSEKVINWVECVEKGRDWNAHKMNEKPAGEWMICLAMLCCAVWYARVILLL